MDAQVFYDKYLLLDVCICLHFLRQNHLPNTLCENHYNLNNTSFPGKILVYIVNHYTGESIHMISLKMMRFL